jgi:hypothetical protein
MLTFNEETKAKYLARVREHMRLDQIVQGIGYEDGRGCAVGCTLDAYHHAAYERELGIPASIACLEDALHEGMSIELAKQWPERFLAAVPCERDLSAALPRFLIWLLTEECPSDAGRAIAALYQRRLDANEPTSTDWESATAWAAWAAAEDRAALWAALPEAEAATARAGRRSAAAWAAAAAGRAAAADKKEEAVAAVRSAAHARAAGMDLEAARGARRACYVRMADKLVEILGRTDAGTPETNG